LCPLSSFFFPSSTHLLHLHSFPTRRSSDLPFLVLAMHHNLLAEQFLAIQIPSAGSQVLPSLVLSILLLHYSCTIRPYHLHTASRDRKSTRLNSSHGSISYAVFCLKKKINIHGDVVLGSSLLRQGHRWCARAGRRAQSPRAGGRNPRSGDSQVQLVLAAVTTSVNLA